MCYILNRLQTPPRADLTTMCYKNAHPIQAFYPMLTSHQSSLQRSASAARSAALVSHKNIPNAVQGIIY